jgi:23S rRNA (uracil1939-C5)-methyltransferase
MFETVLNEIKAYLHSYSQLALHKKLSSLIDLYCGVGTIGVSLSEHFDRIVGVELTQSAQYFAQENAKSNSVQNFTFYSGATEKQILGLITEEDVLVIDPPRAGCHKNVISEILNCVPKLIIYLSCNPETQLRDIELLVSKYDIDLVKTYDFFPNTDHLENLVILKKNP